MKSNDKLKKPCPRVKIAKPMRERIGPGNQDNPVTLQLEPAWYRGEESPLPGAQGKFFLAEGTHPFDPPQAKDGLLLADSLVKLTTDVGTLTEFLKFHEVDLTKADRNFRERFNLTKDQLVDFDNSGHRIIRDVVRMFNKTGRLRVYAIGPSFPGFVNEIVSYSGKAIPDLRYIRVDSELTMTQEQKVDILLNNVESHTKKRKAKGQNGDNTAIVIESPSNPAGDTISLTKKREIASFADENGIIVVFDEAFGDFQDDSESAVHLTKEFLENVVVIRTFSKPTTYRAGGVIIGSPFIRDDWKKVKIPFDQTIVPELLLGALSDPEILIPYMKSIREKTKEIKSPLIKQLREEGLIVAPTNDEVPIALVGVPRSDDMGSGETLFYSKLLSLDLEAAPGAGFHNTDNKMDNGWVRITIPRNKKDIPIVVKRIKGAMTSLSTEMTSKFLRNEDVTF